MEYSAIKGNWDTDAYYDTDEPWKYYTKWKKPDGKGQTL